MNSAHPFISIPPPDPSAQKLIDIDGLSERVIRTLHNEGIDDLGQLRLMREQDLLRLPDFGRKALAVVQALLGQSIYKDDLAYRAASAVVQQAEMISAMRSESRARAWRFVNRMRQGKLEARVEDDN